MITHVTDTERRLQERVAALEAALINAMRVLSDLPSTSQEGTRTRAAWLDARAALEKQP